ncbi:type ISP restriction/modification enzyme [Micrococcus sp. TA1]|uniref:type ISP restriction/modification enzyme n=1 Tax=Micrococcus sp. TA1 TaxID=681627 RepID=UPI00161BB131|nr:type ISP restriction/modification enzyme [Micrococcus sp. TA1]MBB5750112.1 type I restriction-modification system DNA methylase subunit [Micrococcus sp. TA1]
MNANKDHIRRLIQAAPKSADHLLDLLLNGLDWPIPDDLSWGDIQLEWEPEELHLDPEKVAKLKQISQIPPLTTNQNFGVFVLDFEGGRLPVGAIRRLVQRLVKNERARKGSGTHAQWSLNDLLFFCLSAGQDKLLHVVNFREKDGKRVLRVLSWNAQLTNARLDLLVRRGIPDLLWSPVEGPKIVIDPSYGKGFHGYREGIKSAATLSRRMAEVAQDVRDEVRALYEVETDEGPIRALFDDVRNQLLGDLTPERFADVYAQTMVYGLLTARIAHPEEFKVEQSVSALKFDNEFLDAIYSRFRNDSDGIIDVDELGLNELAEELAATDVDELLADFGADNQRDDPVVYFYEEFLAQYDPDQRRDLGAFYTPLPVVRYIIKTVDDALKSFGLPLGVADSTTWAEYVETYPEIDIPKRAKPHDPVVSMFDPANGTGTFLVEWLRQARRNAGEAGEAAALAHASACEISLASYAVSHLKVSLDISESLREKARLPIYLGDTLGAKHDHVIAELADPISTEGAHADEVKYEWNHNVLIGNPPYDRVESTGTGGHITALQDGTSRSLFDDIFDDAKKHVIFSAHASVYNLYVYFWRWAIWKVFEENSGPAVVSMITASSWLDGPGFLGLRRLAREVADEIVVVNLHGDNKGTRKDENVFNIESPVAIVTLIRRANGDRRKPAAVRYASYRGIRAEKLAALTDLASGRIKLTTVEASSDWHAPFIPDSGGADWAAYPRIVDLFPLQQPGMMINRTWPAAPDRATLTERWKAFVATKTPDERAHYYVTPSTGRRITTKVPGLVPLAQLDAHESHRPIVRFGMRSFDRQWIFSDPRLIALERPALWASLSDKQVFLTTMTTTSLGSGPAATLTTAVPDKHHFRGSYGGKDVIPLYRDSNGTPNVDPRLLSVLTERHRETNKNADTVTIERLFAYTFGVLAGTDYTTRFHEALETAGPRVPITADPEIFTRMEQHGSRLIWLQTFGERFGTGKLPTVGIEWTAEPTRLPDTRSDIAYDENTETLRVADGTLVGVPPAAWTFEVSGMEVIPKWLGYRMTKPAGRAASSSSPLDQLRPTAWSSEWSTELVEIVTVLKETLEMIPTGVDILDEIIAGPLLAAEELPSAPASLRQPPKTRKTQATENASLFDDGTFPGM